MASGTYVPAVEIESLSPIGTGSMSAVRSIQLISNEVEELEDAEGDEKRELDV